MAETRGLLLGKFLPPHRGHQYLIDFARAYADHVTVHVCSTPAEPIPGVLRFAWMREQWAGCPNVTVVHNDDPNPQTPADSPSEAEFYRVWRESLLRHTPNNAPPDLVFASEPYGTPLADCLGARYVPVDHLRERVPISGTRLRDDIHAHWRYLLPPARPHFARRIALVGPESSGKSTLTARLAAHFDAPFAAEYARGYLDADPARWIGENGVNGFDADALHAILRGQCASVEAMARQCENIGLVFSDTEAIVTACWANVLLGSVPDFVAPFIRAQRFDLYLLNTATRNWVDDASQRVQPDYADRLSFEQACRRHLDTHGYPYVTLRGDWNERFAQAVAAVEGQMSTRRD